MCIRDRHGTDRFPEVAGDFSDQLSIQVIGDAAERFVHIARRDDIVRQRHGDIERRQGVVGRIIGSVSYTHLDVYKRQSLADA